MNYDKQEIYEQLQCFMSFFPGSSNETLDKLNSLDVEELNMDTESTREVTPLIQQLCKYSLVFALEEDEERDKLICFYQDPDASMLDCIYYISELCYNYVLEFQRDHCKHPSIVNVDNILKGCTLYKDMINSADYIAYKKNMDMNKIAEIDESVNLSVERKFQKLMSEMDEWKETTPCQLLIAISNYMLDKAAILMNLGADEMFEVYKERKRYMDFTDAFLQINEYKKYTIDESIRQAIEEMEEAYHMYKCYKYYYGYNSKTEQYLLKK